MILRDILRSKLVELNSYSYGGTEYKFSNENIERAVNEIDEPLADNLVASSEKVYDDLMLGKSYPEKLPDGRLMNFNIHYIDWENFSNNVDSTYNFTDSEKLLMTADFFDICIINNKIFCNFHKSFRLSKYILTELSEFHPRVIIVTDRKDLDNQIAKTFSHTRLSPAKATSGKHLIELIRNNKADASIAFMPVFFILLIK